MDLTTVLAIGGILFGGGGLIAIAAWLRKQGKDAVIAQQTKENLDVATKQLDIANKPDDTPDDTADWLSGK